LAIDWGSEAVRAKLFRTAEDGRIVIDKLVQYASTIEDMTSDRQELKRQFTSQIYPFGHTSPNPPGEMVYPGNKRIMERRSISSKLAMYGILEIPAELAEQSLELQQLCDFIQQNPQLKQIVRIGIEQMLFCVLRRVYEELTWYPDLILRILDAIALTVPAQWPIEFEEEYGQRLMAAWQRVFDYPLPQIIFLSEGQANAHYALSFAAHSDRQYLPEPQQDIFSIGSTTNAVLIIDAGGHSTVSPVRETSTPAHLSKLTGPLHRTHLSSLSVKTAISWKSAPITVSFSISYLYICNALIRSALGALGGTAMWGLRILNLAKKSREEKFPEKPPMPVEAENQILKSFYLWSPELRDDSGACFNVRNAGPNRETFDYELEPQELVQTFEEANAHAFDLIEAGMRELKALQPGCEKVKVMIGGGSAHGLMWVARMKRLVAKHQMEEPIFLQQIDKLYE
jgi:hypothetical protein